MKKNRKKITLSRETLRALTVEGPELRRLLGAYKTQDTCGRPCSALCTQAGLCTIAPPCACSAAQLGGL
jgi:hypothetical protein